MTTGNDLIDDYLSELMDDPGKGKPAGKSKAAVAAAARAEMPVDDAPTPDTPADAADAADRAPELAESASMPAAIDASADAVEPSAERDDSSAALSERPQLLEDEADSQSPANAADDSAGELDGHVPAVDTATAEPEPPVAEVAAEAAPVGDPLAAFREGGKHISDDEFEAMLDAMQGKPAPAAAAVVESEPAGDPLAAFREGGKHISDDEFEAMLDALAGAPPAVAVPMPAPAAAAVAPAAAVVPLASEPALPAELAEPPVHRPRVQSAALEGALAGGAGVPVVHDMHDHRRRRADDRVISWLRFNLARQCFAVEVLKVQEVLRVPFILPVRGTEAAMLGVMNLRGQIVPVMDLSVRLGFAAVEPNEASRVIVLEENGETLGLLVASVADVLNLSEGRMERISGTPSLVAAEVVRGISRRDGQIIIMLDATRLLG